MHYVAELADDRSRYSGAVGHTAQWEITTTLVLSIELCHHHGDLLQLSAGGHDGVVRGERWLRPR